LPPVHIDAAKRPGPVHGPNSCWARRLRARASRPATGWPISIWQTWARPSAPCQRDRLQFRARA